MRTHFLIAILALSVCGQAAESKALKKASLAATEQLFSDPKVLEISIDMPQAQLDALKKEPRVFVNPEILAPAEELSTYQEGCLSVPEIYADVDRPKACRVRWQDLQGKVHEEDMEGMLATCIQHEMDHLEGILFIDHLSRLRRSMALKKLEKLRKAA